MQKEQFTKYVVSLKLLVLLLCSNRLTAQNDVYFRDANLMPFARLMVRIDPARFVFREPHIGIEWRNTYQNSHEIRLGYRYPQPVMQWFYETWAFYTRGKFSGPSISYQYRYHYLGKSNERYWLLGAHYQYSYFTDRYLWLGGLSGGSNINDVILSQW